MYKKVYLQLSSPYVYSWSVVLVAGTKDTQSKKYTVSKCVVFGFFLTLVLICFYPCDEYNLTASKLNNSNGRVSHIK